MNIIMAVIGLVGLKRAPECIKTHHFEGENDKNFDPPPRPHFWIRACAAPNVSIQLFSLQRSKQSHYLCGQRLEAFKLVSIAEMLK